MGMMLPNELIWVMEKLGFDWPDIDEDELRRGGHIIEVFRTELEGKLLGHAAHRWVDALGCKPSRFGRGRNRAPQDFSNGLPLSRSGGGAQP